jgi:hypothetical protein
MDGISDDENANSTATKRAIESNNTDRNETTTTKGGYRRIEEWHEETNDSKHVIRQLKQEKAKWRKAFDDFGK